MFHHQQHLVSGNRKSPFPKFLHRPHSSSPYYLLVRFETSIILFSLLFFTFLRLNLLVCLHVYYILFFFSRCFSENCYILTAMHSNFCYFYSFLHASICLFCFFYSALLIEMCVIAVLWEIISTLGEMVAL